MSEGAAGDRLDRSLTETSETAASATLPLWETIDDETAAILRLVHGDRIHERDRAEVVRAIVAAAEDDDGLVDPGEVRLRLSGRAYPRVVGATYAALRRAGVLVPVGWTISTDVSGGNAGRPARTYRLAFVPDDEPGVAL